MLGALNQNQVNNVLSSQVLGRLACTDGKKPYIIPLTYTYDGKFIYGQTNDGTKLNILRKNSNVCFQVEVMTDMRNWQSVIVYGVFEELKDKAAVRARKILLDRVFPLATSSTIHSYGHLEEGEIDDTNSSKSTMYRIRITSVSGRFEKQ